MGGPFYLYFSDPEFPGAPLSTTPKQAFLVYSKLGCSTDPEKDPGGKKGGLFCVIHSVRTTTLRYKGYLGKLILKTGSLPKFNPFFAGKGRKKSQPTPISAQKEWGLAKILAQCTKPSVAKRRRKGFVRQHTRRRLHQKKVPKSLGH